MNTKVLDAMMGKLAPIVHQTIVDAVKPFEARLAAIEQREPEKGDAGPQGLPGSSVTVDDIVPVINEAVAKAVESFPRPQDGLPGDKGDPGHSVTIADVEPIITAEVERAVASLPPPKDGRDGEPGKSVTTEEVEPLISEAVAKAVASLPVPKDGAPGKDGRDGEPGKSVTTEEVEPLISEAVAKAVASLPVPKDGAPGKDGRDGIQGPPGDIAYAPQELALHVASAIRLLAESPVPAVAAVVSPPLHLSLDLSGTYTKRSYRFDRGENNEVLVAHEEARA